ncbi:uncharacterized protein LOC126589980 [Malus sylvestris]|uniref:uncharacterized protein LOC126589980 n=1 Tax=Malus sylvestris TaxID=3752 RepID=UPI0021AC5525|nr:uncharacterized protein LOC126589980 [Malus sylvestris]
MVTRGSSFSMFRLASFSHCSHRLTSVKSFSRRRTQLDLSSTSSFAEATKNQKPTRGFFLPISELLSLPHTHTHSLSPPLKHLHTQGSKDGKSCESREEGWKSRALSFASRISSPYRSVALAAIFVFSPISLQEPVLGKNDIVVEPARSSTRFRGFCLWLSNSPDPQIRL